MKNTEYLSKLVTSKFFILFCTKKKNRIIRGKSSRFIPKILNPKLGGINIEMEIAKPIFFAFKFCNFIPSNTVGPAGLEPATDGL